MEPGYALAVCVGCFSMGLTGPVVPNDYPSRILAPESFMTRCFTGPNAWWNVPYPEEHPYPVIPRKVQLASESASLTTTPKVSWNP